MSHKMIVLGLLLISISSLANEKVDWTKIAKQAEASTNLQLCYKSVINGSQDPKDCLTLQNSCKATGLNDQDIARTWEAAKLEHKKVSKWDQMADASIKETDDQLKSEIDRFTEIDSEIQNLIFNH